MALRHPHLIGVCILDTHRCCFLLLACIHDDALLNIYSSVLTTCYHARIRTGKVKFLSLPCAHVFTEVSLTATVSWF